MYVPNDLEERELDHMEPIFYLPKYWNIKSQNENIFPAVGEKGKSLTAV